MSVYFVQGVHFCVNVVCLTEGAGAVLLRAGVVSDLGVSRFRRPTACGCRARLEADAAGFAGHAGLRAQCRGLGRSGYRDSIVRGPPMIRRCSVLFHGSEEGESGVFHGRTR
ncbi:DNA-3-methyladenine glycosylase [Pseudonocardia acaciae]|uniref:DNA-3-methyladenine glycosylase n=1 Tax=Pseudonocardia acaciae TaxID=551276 RepID=UPI003CCB8BC2